MSTQFATSALGRRLETGRLLFDGPLGSALEHAGTLPGTLFESLNTANPALIKAIHTGYLRAGCTILTANTFAANGPTLHRYGVETPLAEVIAAGVAIAREAADGQALVAGSIAQVSGPDDAEQTPEAYREQIALLRDAGIDLLAFESFESGDALRAALIAAAQEAPDVPVVAQMRITTSVAGDETARLEALAAEASEAFDLGADVFGLNCGLAPREMFPLVQYLRNAFPRKLLVAQPSVGPTHPTAGRMLQTTSPDAFATYGRRFLKLGVDILGSCCGTSVEHTRALSGAIRMSDAQAATAPSTATIAFPASRAATEDRPGLAAPAQGRGGAFGEKLGQSFVTSVEINPPGTIDHQKAIAAAKRVLDGGATVINTTDGARASLRMDNLAFATIVRQELGCDPLLHVCGRDRSLLGSVSHLMAAHALGIRNLVLITGDPPKMGAFPSSSPVFDVDSVALLRIVNGLNHGIDPSGKEMDQPTAFLCGTGVEPAASDLDYEVDRLFRKKEAGADFVMTQPVYDDETLLRFLEAAKGIDLPILMDVVPLASARNAAFVHANVPGMKIPAHILRRMEQAGDGPEARQEGVDIAIESLQHARATEAIHGAYIVPPLGFYSSAIRIIEAMAS